MTTAAPRRARSALPRTAPPVAALLRTIQLSKFFQVRGSRGSDPALCRAVRGVSFTLQEGETLGVTGETGSGKSTLGRLVARLIEPSLGRVLFRGRDLTHLSERELRPLRRQISLVPQDATSSLNPRLSVREVVAEGLLIHRLARTGDELAARVEAALRQTGVPPGVQSRRAGELSAGESQRVCLARALAMRPSLLVLDDPVDALDPPQRDSLLRELLRSRAEHDSGHLLLSHDLQTLFLQCSRILVLHAGTVVESGPASAIAIGPRHPYTQSLLSALPTLQPRRRRLRLLANAPPPSALAPLRGCGYFERCPHREPGLCDERRPALSPVASEPGQEVACFKADG